MKRKKVKLVTETQYKLLYAELRSEMQKTSPNIVKVAFLVGAIHTLRVDRNYEVPEIEDAFRLIEAKLGRSEVEWLLTLYTVPKNFTL